MLAVTAEKNTGSTLGERIEFANPHFSKNKCVNGNPNSFSFSGDSEKMERDTTFLARKCCRIDVVRPHENDFACMLAALFKGLCLCEVPIPAVLFSEPLWTINELTTAIRRLKNDKGGDEVELTAEL